MSRLNQLKSKLGLIGLLTIAGAGYAAREYYLHQKYYRPPYTSPCLREYVPDPTIDTDDLEIIDMDELKQREDILASEEFEEKLIRKVWLQQFFPISKQKEPEELQKELLIEWLEEREETQVKWLEEQE